MAESTRSRVRAALHTTFRSFAIRNFRLFFAGQFISQIGTWLTTIALTLLVLHRTGRGLAVGALTACQFGPVLILGAWAGVIADRSDKRRLLIATQTMQMIQSFVLGALAFIPSTPLIAFYGTALAGGVLLAFDNPARRAFVVEMVPPENMQNAVTLNTAIMTSSRIFGPAIAGLLIVTTGFGWSFTIDGLSYIAVIGGLLMMRKSELLQPPVTRRAKRQVRDGILYVRRTHVLWVPMVMTAIIGVFAFNFPVVIPLFVERTLGGNDSTYTVLFSVLSIGSVLAALFASHRRTIDAHMIVAAAISFGGGLVVFAAAPNLAFAFPLALVVGFTSILFMTSSTAIIQSQADPAMRGRVVALQALVFIGSTPIGGPILGAICDRFGARAGLIVGGVAAAGAGAWGYWATRHDVPPGGLPDLVLLQQAGADEIEVA